MIDCHCHLGDRDFDSDLDDVVARAKEAGVLACIVVPENINDFQRVLDICEKHKGFLFPCLGVHPAQNFRDEKVILGTLKHLYSAPACPPTRQRIRFPKRIVSYFYIGNETASR